MQQKISKLLSETFIAHSNHDVNVIIELASRFNDHGFKTNGLGLAQFICQDHEAEKAKKLGLPSYLNHLRYIKFKPIKAQPTTGRNQMCPCDSGKKFKKCCLTQNANI